MNRENEYFHVSFEPENPVSRDGFGSPVPRQPAHLYTQADVNRSLTFLQRDLGVPLGGGCDWFVLIAEALQDDIQDARLSV